MDHPDNISFFSSLRDELMVKLQKRGSQRGADYTLSDCGYQSYDNNKIVVIALWQATSPSCICEITLENDYVIVKNSYLHRLPKYIEYANPCFIEQIITAIRQFVTYARRIA